MDHKYCKYCQKDVMVCDTNHWYTKRDGNKLYLICRLQKRKWCQNWDNNNPEKAKIKYAQKRNKRRSTVEGRLRHNLSSLISYHINKKNSNMSKYLNYSIEDLKNHLESKFEPGMTWNNYGEWEIDHKKPASWFHYSSTEETSFKDCWALENLQPMWAFLNKSKGNRYKG